MKLVLLSGAVLTLLTVAEAAMPQSASFLPIGGSSISQMGIILGTAVATSTIIHLWRGGSDE